jgi:cold shock CspA family protein
MNQSILHARIPKESFMQRGIIKSYDRSSSCGLIGRPCEVDVKFYADRVVGRDRASLHQGDPVWFEVEQINHMHVAVNVRKCM